MSICIENEIRKGCEIRSTQFKHSSITVVGFCVAAAGSGARQRITRASLRSTTVFPACRGATRCGRQSCGRRLACGRRSSHPMDATPTTMATSEGSDVD